VARTIGERARALPNTFCRPPKRLGEQIGCVWRFAVPAPPLSPPAPASVRVRANVTFDRLMEWSVWPAPSKHEPRGSRNNTQRADSPGGRCARGATRATSVDEVRSPGIRRTVVRSARACPRARKRLRLARSSSDTDIVRRKCSLSETG
jgi:hypothetical protein